MKKAFLVSLLVFAACFLCFVSCDNVSNEPANTDDVTESHEHYFGEWQVTKHATCTEVGEQQRSCRCGTVETDVIDIVPHTEKVLNAVVPTCTETGLTEGKYCSVCEKVLVEQEVINSLEHTEVVDDGIPPTCTDTGISDGKHCGVCGDILVSQETVEKLEHSYNDEMTCEICGDYADKGVVFTLNNNEYSVTLYTGKSSKVVIPSTYQGIAVTGIADWAFFSCDSLTEVVIPDSITSIGDCAFNSCSNLTDVVIPNGVTSIGGGAFFYCGNLKNVVIPESVTINGNLFADCFSLTSIKVDANNPNYKDIDGNLYTKDGKTLIQYAIGKTETSFTIPEGVMNIGYYSFSDCISLVSVVIPEGVVSIDDYAFANCGSLASIVIPESVTNIGSSAFNCCSNLASVLIPASVTSIGSSAFFSCNSLSSIVVDPGNDVFKDIDGNLYDKNGTALIQYAIGKTEASFAVPYGVTNIHHSAFSNCSSLTCVTIPDSVMSVEGFYNCSSLASINVDANNTNYKDIDGNMYSKDGKILIQYAIGKTETCFNIPDSVTTVGSGAFSNCQALTSIVMPGSITGIGTNAFKDCNNLTSVVIPNSVTHIGYSAFEGCSSLVSVTIPDSVRTIEMSAFERCDSLTGIKVDEKNTKYKDIDGNLYNKNGTTLIQYAIGKTATSFTIPDGVVTVSNHAFVYCSNLTEIVIPKTVCRIADSAFHFCSNLETVNYMGSKDEWEMIHIEDTDSPLYDATINYKYVPTGE